MDLEGWLLLGARGLLCTAYLVSAVDKTWHWNARVRMLADRGWRYPRLQMGAANVVMALGGLSLLLGYYTWIGCLALFLFTGVATVMVHRFWRLEGFERMIQMMVFFEHLAIMGGLVALAVHGPGPISLDPASGLLAATR